MFFQAAEDAEIVEDPGRAEDAAGEGLGDAGDGQVDVLGEAFGESRQEGAASGEKDAAVEMVDGGISGNPGDGGGDSFKQFVKGRAQGGGDFLGLDDGLLRRALLGRPAENTQAAAADGSPAATQGDLYRFGRRRGDAQLARALQVVADGLIQGRAADV